MVEISLLFLQEWHIFLMLLLHTTRYVSFPLQSLTIFLLIISLSLCDRFRQTEKITLISLRYCGPKVNILISRKAPNIRMLFCLHLSSPCRPFRSQWLKNRSRISIMVLYRRRSVAHRSLSNEPQISPFDLCKTQSFLFVGSHQQNKFTYFLIEMRNVATLVVEYSHQTLSDHSFLQPFDPVFEYRLAKTIRTILTQEKTHKNYTHTENAALLCWSKAYFLRREETFIISRIIHIYHVKQFECFLFGKIYQIFCMKTHPQLVPTLLFLSYIEQNSNKIHPLNRSLEPYRFRPIAHIRIFHNFSIDSFIFGQKIVKSALSILKQQLEGELIIAKHRFRTDLILHHVATKRICLTQPLINFFKFDTAE